MTPKKTVRLQNAALICSGIDDVRRALERIQGLWDIWADDVRQDAEARQGVPAGADLKREPEYWRALDMLDAIRKTRLAFQAVEACLDETETMAKPAEAEAEP